MNPLAMAAGPPPGSTAPFTAPPVGKSCLLASNQRLCMFLSCFAVDKEAAGIAEKVASSAPDSDPPIAVAVSLLESLSL